MTTYTRHFDLLTGWNGWQAQDDTAEITDCDDIKGWLDEIDAEPFVDDWSLPGYDYHTGGMRDELRDAGYGDFGPM